MPGLHPKVSRRLQRVRDAQLATRQEPLAHRCVQQLIDIVGRRIVFTGPEPPLAHLAGTVSQPDYPFLRGGRRAGRGNVRKHSYVRNGSTHVVPPAQRGRNSPRTRMYGALATPPSAPTQAPDGTPCGKLVCTSLPSAPRPILVEPPEGQKPHLKPAEWNRVRQTQRATCPGAATRSNVSGVNKFHALLTLRVRAARVEVRGHRLEDIARRVEELVALKPLKHLRGHLADADVPIVTLPVPAFGRARLQALALESHPRPFPPGWAETSGGALDDIWSRSS